MGAVYRAVQVSLNRVVALKVIPAGSRGGDVARARFRAEAEAVARLQHSNIVQVYDFGECEGGVYLALEFCGGGRLADQLDGTPWGVEAAARLVATLARAAHAAHERGVIHRDLKPANVLLTEDGQLKIIDFGIAALVHPGGLATSEIVGTPAYMAPEQAAGEGHKIGPAIDIYALGAMLYELLTGRPPFRGGSAFETLRLVVHEEPVRPGTLRSGLPTALEAVCLQCLAKDPGRRPSTALALARRLSDSLQDAYARGHAPDEGAGDLAALLRQRAAAEKAHRRHERLLNTLFQDVGAGVVLLDAHGRVIRTGPAVEDLFGPAPVGATLAAWLRADPDAPYGNGAAWLEGTVARALAGETVTDAEAFVRPTGRSQGVWLSATARPLPGDDGAPEGAVLVLEDVSERRALRDSEALYASLIETLPMNVFRKDLDGRFTFVNRAFCRMLGLPPGRILGRTDHDLFPATMANKYRSDDQQVARGEVFEEIEEHQQAACGSPCRCGRRRADGAGLPEGATKFLHVLLAPVYDSEGRLAGTQGVYWDVTPRILAERQAEAAAAELRAANAELARSKDDLEQFAYSTSHDFKTPLRNIATYIELLQRRYQDRLDTQANEYIGFASDGARWMQRLVDDLHDYLCKRARTLRVAQVPSRALFDQAVRNLQATISESGARVTCGPLPTVWCDATQVTEVFQNLLGNGIKFCRSRAPLVDVTAEARDGFWVFAVRDNGIGIKPEHADKIFALFRQLHPRGQYPGTGIGLALCKKIVERHGGRIWVESQPDAGSVFFFTLPIEPPGDGAKAGS
jgi:PAS domain S-box-containing protein